MYVRKAPIKNLVNHTVNSLQSRYLYAFCSTVIREVRIAGNTNPLESKIKKFRK